MNQDPANNAPHPGADQETTAASSPRWDRASFMALAKGLLLLLTLAGLAWGLKAAGIADALDTRWAEEHLKNKHLGWLLFLGFAIPYTAAGLPRQLMCFIGGYAFGFLAGGLLALGATLAGCAVSFSYARFLGREFVTRKFGKRLQRINTALARNPFSMTLIIRFLPFGSNIVTNMVAGVSAIPAAWFLLGSLVGFMPQTFIFALLGSGIRVDPIFTTLLSAALLAASIILGLVLYRRYRLQDVVREDD